MSWTGLEYWTSEWLLFNARWAIFLLYHDKNKLLLIRWCLLCTRLTCWFYFYSASSLKQHLVGRHFTLFWHIILISSQSCWVEKQQILILLSLVWPDGATNPWSTTLGASMLAITPPMQVCRKFWFIGLEGVGCMYLFSLSAIFQLYIVTSRLFRGNKACTNINSWVVKPSAFGRCRVTKTLELGQRLLTMLNILPPTAHILLM